ncbi:MAG: hypothetical protein JWR89_4746 [Tardiphaga sp.]|uniref:hypothetical protein n=1 Tax=Tardiphaga sp. TaxID=1926292 RepID=UPI0026287420|nr:hypothetical protein [Tardiphaga sp.]MDB5504844.1 hypothetical protein [Tardiphaga sp.]
MPAPVKHMSPDLVLTTVNAPYSQHLDALELVGFLLDHSAAKTVPGHMSSFFGEVKPELQLEFASMFGISKPQLVAAARSFATYSGQPYPLAK